MAEICQHYSRKDAAEVLGVSRQRVQQLIVEVGVHEHDHGLPPASMETLIERQLLRAATRQYKPPGHISMAEAAERLNIVESTFRVGVHRGQIPAIAIGARKWIREDWVAQQQKGDS